MEKAVWIGVKVILRMRTVLETEANALKWTIIFSTKLDYRRVIFESYSKELVEALSDDDVWRVLQPLYKDIKTLILGVKCIKLVFRPRDENRVADKVVKEIIIIIFIMTLSCILLCQSGYLYQL